MDQNNLSLSIASAESRSAWVNSLNYVLNDERYQFGLNLAENDARAHKKLMVSVSYRYRWSPSQSITAFAQTLHGTARDWIENEHPELLEEYYVDSNDTSRDGETSYVAPKTFTYGDWRNLLKSFVDYFGGSDAQREADKKFKEIRQGDEESDVGFANRAYGYLMASLGFPRITDYGLCIASIQSHMRPPFRAIDRYNCRTFSDFVAEVQRVQAKEERLDALIDEKLGELNVNDDDEQVWEQDAQATLDSQSGGFDEYFRNSDDEFDDDDSTGSGEAFLPYQSDDSQQ